MQVSLCILAVLPELSLFVIHKGTRETFKQKARNMATLNHKYILRIT